MSEIAIRDIELWGYHGCLPEENVVGTKYFIDFTMNFDTSKCEITDNVNDTINYADVYNIISEEFKTPVNLIEHLGRKILDSVIKAYPEIKTANVKIKKINPPINKFDGYVEVTVYYP